MLARASANNESYSIHRRSKTTMTDRRKISHLKSCVDGKCRSTQEFFFSVNKSAHRRVNIYDCDGHVIFNPDDSYSWPLQVSEIRKKNLENLYVSVLAIGCTESKYSTRWIELVEAFHKAGASVRYDHVINADWD